MSRIIFIIYLVSVWMCRGDYDKMLTIETYENGMLSHSSLWTAKRASIDDNGGGDIKRIEYNPWSLKWICGVCEKGQKSMGYFILKEEGYNDRKYVNMGYLFEKSKSAEDMLAHLFALDNIKFHISADENGSGTIYFDIQSPIAFMHSSTGYVLGREDEGTFLSVEIELFPNISFFITKDKALCFTYNHQLINKYNGNLICVLLDHSSAEAVDHELSRVNVEPGEDMKQKATQMVSKERAKQRIATNNYPHKN